MSKIIDSLFVSIGVDPEGARKGFQAIQDAAQKADSEFNNLSQKWAGVVKGLVSTVIAPVAGAFAIGSVVNSYMSDISQVATMTGAYSQKLEEWRLKRAQLARVTKEDIELYKKSREAITSFKIAMGDLSASIMRQSMPIMKMLIDGLNKFTGWLNRNMKNITRSITVVAGTLTAVFLPAFIKVGAAMLASPLTWVVAAIAMLALVVDDLVTYMQGGKTALSGFWSMFGTGKEITQALTTAFEVLKSVVSVLAKPLALLAAGFVAFKGGTVIIGGVVKAVTSLRMALTALAANPIVAVLMALLSVILWISDAFKRADGQWGKVFGIMLQDVIDFLNIFGGLGDAIVNLFSSIGEKLQPLFDFIGDCLTSILEPFQGLFDAVIGIFDSFVSLISNGLKFLWGAITGDSDKNQSALLDGIANAARGFLSNIGNLISEAFGLIASFIINLPETVWSAIKAIIKMDIELLSNLSSLIVKAASFIANGLAKGMSAAWDFIKSGFSSLVSFLTGIGDTIVSGLAGLGGAVISSLSDMLSGLASWIANICTAILEASIRLVADIVQTAVGAFESIKNGINKAIDFVGNILKAAFKPFISALQGAFNKAKEVFEKIKATVARFISAGLDLLLSLGSSIGDAFIAVKDAVSNALGAMLRFASGVFNQVASVISNALSAAIEYISSFIDSAKEFFQGLLQSIIGVFSQFVDIISNALSAAIESVSNFISSIFDYFSQIPEYLAKVFDVGALIDKATNAVKDKVKGAWKDVKGFLGLGDDEEEDKPKAAPQDEQVLPTAKSAQAQESKEQPNRAQPEGYSQSQLTRKDKASQSLGLTASRSAVAPNGSSTDLATNQEASRAQTNMAAFFSDLRQGMNSMMQEFSKTPVTADTTNMVTNTYQSNTRQVNSQRNNTTTININAPSGDPRAIARAVQNSMPQANSTMAYVSSSESGNWYM